MRTAKGEGWPRLFVVATLFVRLFTWWVLVIQNAFSTGQHLEVPGRNRRYCIGRSVRLGSVHAPLNDALRLKSSLAKVPAAAMRHLARLATQAIALLSSTRRQAPCQSATLCCASCTDTRSALLSHTFFYALIGTLAGRASYDRNSVNRA